MIDSGSTMISSAALVAVERASPQWLSAKAPAKPTTPIQTMRQASPRAGAPAGASSARAIGTRMAAPTTSRTRARNAGGRSSSTTRVTT
jgi:hypothetical protein